MAKLAACVVAMLGIFLNPVHADVIYTWVTLSATLDGVPIRSCPRAWCRSGGGVAISGEVGRKRQAVTADSLTIGSSLKGAMVSRDI